MKLIAIVLLIAGMGGAANASDFSGLQSMGAADLAKAPIYSQQFPPVPNAPIWPANNWPGNYNQDPFPQQQPGYQLDTCKNTGESGGKCLFVCESGRTLVQDKIDNGTPGGACAQYLFQTITPQMRDRGEKLWDDGVTGQNFCYYTGYDNNSCNYQCQTGATPAIRPLKPYAAGNVPVIPVDNGVCPSYIQGLPQLQGAKAAVNPAQIPQVPTFIPAWNYYHNNPLPMPPQDTIDICKYTGIEGGKCVFSCESGDTLAEDKLNSGTGEEACASYIFRSIPGPFWQFKSAEKSQKGLRGCLFTENTADTCVYACDDGSSYTRPMKRPSPFGDEPLVPCPQAMLAF